MKASNHIISLIICASLLLSAGCVKLWQKNLDIKTYMIEVNRDAQVLEKPLANKLWIDRVTVLPPYNMRNLVIRKTDVEFMTSYYTELLISPADNFRNAFFAWFGASGIFDNVSLEERAGMTHRLKISVMDFYGNSTDHTALLKVKVSLFDEKTKGVGVLFSKDYFQQTGLAEVNAENLILAYNAALSQVLSDCEKDVLQALK